MSTNKKPRRKPRTRPLAVRRGPDAECVECFGYPFHETWCRVVRDN